MPNPILFDQLTKNPVYNLYKRLQTNHQDHQKMEKYRLKNLAHKHPTRTILYKQMLSIL